MQRTTSHEPTDLLTEREALDCEILYLLEREPEITQRELAQRMGVSVGRTNYCLRALAGRGWLKLERFRAAQRKGRYIYVLTPGGLAERSRMAGRFLKRKRAEYDHLKAQIAELERDVERSGGGIVGVSLMFSSVGLADISLRSFGLS